jgi:hypothetical protein
VDEVYDQEDPYREYGQRKQDVKYYRRLIGIRIYLTFDLFIPYQGKDPHQGAKTNQEYAENRRVPGCRGASECPPLAGLPTQEIRELLNEQTELLNDKAECHNADARSDPGKESPLIRHVEPAITGPRKPFIFRYGRSALGKVFRYFYNNTHIFSLSVFLLSINLI